METIRTILAKSTGYFSERSIPSPRLEAEVLLAFALGTDRLHLYMHADKPLGETELKKMRGFLKKRAEGFPTAYLTGKREFYSLEFEITHDVLIPRPETETLADEAIEHLRQVKTGCFIEIGAGSGCVSVAVLKNCPAASGTATDTSDAAAALARKNAQRHNVADRLEIRKGDFFAGADKQFDLVVSNPPYVSQQEFENLQPEVKKEPREALVSGPTGLECYREIIRQAPEFLKPEGILVLEIGDGRLDGLKKILDENNFQSEVIRDTAGSPRAARAKLTK